MPVDAAVKVFAIPKPVRKKYQSKDWDLKNPLFKCRLVVADGDDADSQPESQPDIDGGSQSPAALLLRLLDPHGAVIATAPFYGDIGATPCSDSSQHYALIARNGEIRVVLGIGFVDRSDAFDLGLELQNFTRRKLAEDRISSSSWESRMVAARERSAAAGGAAEGAAGATPTSSDKSGSAPAVAAPLAPALAPPAPFKSRFADDSEDEDTTMPLNDAQPAEPAFEHFEDTVDDDFGEFASV